MEDYRPRALQGCAACGRQYDVTGLSSDERVRCPCGSLFGVEARSQLWVGALRCSNCGGTAEPEDEACPWCSAALDEAGRRHTLLCPCCWTRQANGAEHCSRCGVRIAPQALVPLPDGRSCPRCEGGLANRDVAGESVVECGSCGGFWLSPLSFERIASEAVADPRPGARGSRGAPVEGGGAPVRYVPCLTCEDMMFRRNFRHAGLSSGVVVDLCRDHGVWLDAGELERITEFLRTRAGGGDAARTSEVRLEGRAPAPRVARPDGSTGSPAIDLMGFLRELFFEPFA